MKIREAITQLVNEQEDFISIGNEIFMFPEKDGVLIVFSSSDALSLLDHNKIQCQTYEVDLKNFTFEDENSHNFSYRLASNIQLNNLSLKDIFSHDIVPSINNLRRLSNSKPIMLKISQWGGFGGQGSIPGIGQGLGVGNPMSGGGYFDTSIVRTQFDQSLDLSRKHGDDNAWLQSMETRMQENPLYGHKRNDQDWNLKNYRMTYKERRKEKKKDFLKRMLKNRENFNKALDNNSVQNIKLSPIDPKYYIPLEEKLKNKRQQEETDEKRKNIHGPESQFTYFPPSIKQVTAQTIVHNGLSSIFENDIESLENKKAYPDSENGRLRIRQNPWGLYGPTRDDLMINIQDYPQQSSQPTDLKADNNMLWGGVWNNGVYNDKGGDIALDYLSDGYATHQNPGEIQEPIFDSETLPGIINQMRIDLKIKHQNDKKINIPLEKKLQQQHHDPEVSGITPTNYDIQRMDDPYPYSTKNFFTPRMRMNHSNG